MSELIEPSDLDFGDTPDAVRDYIHGLEQRIAELEAQLSSPKFEFQMRATARDPSGYYFPRWDLADKMTVTAATKSEAMKIAKEALGTARNGWGLVFKFDSINQVQEQS